jgi:hypothetical protein
VSDVPIPAPIRRAVGYTGYWTIVLGRRLIFRYRRLWFLLRAQALARTGGSRIAVQLDPTARLGRHILLYIHPGTSNSLHVGAGSFISDDAVLHFQGGSISVGERTEVRRGFKADTSGDLRIGDDAVISYGTYLHCASSVTIADMVGLGEYVTVADSTHIRTPLDVPLTDHIKTSATVTAWSRRGSTWAMEPSSAPTPP